MTSRGGSVLVALGVALGTSLGMACGRDHDDARARVLGKLPASAIAVFAADGASLSHPRLRSVIDTVRPELPASMGCVLDTAAAARAVAIAVLRDGAIVVALATAPELDPKCPVLSKLEPALWVATLGGGELATPDRSVLTSAELERARPYLIEAPLAFTATMRAGSLIASARPAPLEAWLAFDSSDAFAPHAETWLRERVDKLAGNPATAPFANITVRREGSQIVATLLDRGQSNGDVAVAVRTVLDWERDDRARARPSGTLDPCPPITAPVIACKRGAFEVESLAGVRDLLVPAAPHALEPVMRAGMVVGLRYPRPVAALGIAAGDIVLAVDGRQLASEAMYRAALRSKAFSLTLERADRSFAALRFVSRME